MMNGPYHTQYLWSSFNFNRIMHFTQAKRFKGAFLARHAVNTAFNLCYLYL